MPDPKLILPLLDGFLMGETISEHHGVRCYPAMQEKTSDKYIVKSVSVPADSSKLEALLLAGAFPDRAAAVAYFKDLAEGVAKEAVLLQNLSQLEGFSSYKDWQIQPSEDGESFDVYLLGKYRPTLERHLSRNPMTHLGAVNLGLDLCSALAVCRRSGYLYVDLKPSNVFICADNEYRIGDLGFISLVSLPYASLPEKYHSAYTAPEITDAYSALNDTLDVYAVGLILYQVYNNGQLPVVEPGSGEPLPAPEYADYEMASIILKACDPNPQERWQDPTQMGQALVNYMQSNTVNDEPIVPPSVPVEVVEEEITDVPVDEDPSTEEIISEVDQALEAVGVETTEETQEEASVEIAEETEEEAADPEDSEEPPAEEAASEEPPVDEATEEESEDGLEEMLAQADSLIAHETPEPVVAPAPIDVPIPPRIVLTDEEPDEPEEFVEEQLAIPEEAYEPEAPAEEPEDVEEEIPEEPDAYEPEDPTPSKRGKGLLIALISFIVLASLFLGGYLYYKYEYQQTIHSMTLSGVEDRLAVALHSDIDDELLTVVCTDAYGNTKRQSVIDGVAMFTDLAPNTLYKVEVEISGFHELLGKTKGVHKTAEETSISNITASVGPENGSVILNFAVRGPDCDQWKVFYSAEGEEEKFVTCSGHVATISDLTVGKRYTFRIEATSELYVVGTDTVEFTATNIIYPENLTISGFVNNALTVTWNAPEGDAVTSWTVRCYNDTGFDKTITVTDPVAVFEELDRSASYTVEVRAAGMSLGDRVTIAANSVTVLNLAADTSDPTKLKLSWEFEGAALAGGWVVKYTISGMAEPISVMVTEPSVLIDPIIPGCTYDFEIQTANGDPVFDGTFSHTAPKAENFLGYGISSEYFQFYMCLTPDKENWYQNDLQESDYTNSFSVGQSASFAIRLIHEYSTSGDNITTLFVIRNADGALVKADTQNELWRNMWYQGFGKLTIPKMPEAPGDYTVEIYFNGKYVTTQSFTII